MGEVELFGRLGSSSWIDPDRYSGVEPSGARSRVGAGPSLFTLEIIGQKFGPVQKIWPSLSVVGPKNASLIEISGQKMSRS